MIDRQTGEIYSYTYGQTDKRTVIQKSRMADRQTDVQADRQTEKQTDGWRNRQTG